MLVWVAIIFVVVPASAADTGDRVDPVPGDELTAWLPGGELMEFVWIPPGEFSLGTSPSEELVLRELGIWDRGQLTEQPAHRREIPRGFWLGKFEITQRQWYVVMGTKPWSGYLPDDDRCAAVCLSWNAVQRLIARLNQAQGEAVYRLPTEAEWEYACRAGSTSPWFFGDKPELLHNYAWTGKNSGRTAGFGPFPIGLKGPNPWGLHDIYGNAREWCQDLAIPYVESGFVGPIAPLPGDYRIIRGGSVNSSAAYARSAARTVAVPSMLYNILQGARLVRER